MKADLTALRETDRPIAHYRRESSFDREIAAIDPATGRAVVVARFYQPGATSYACLWVFGEASYGRGCGKAGGFGYHKPSAALDAAIRDAGIALSGDVYGRKRTDRPARIDGIGDDAMRAAVEAIARALTGKRRLIIHTAHG